jgi:hypothetical protein
MDRVNSDIAAIAEISGGKLSKMTGCCGRPMCCLSYEIEDMKNIEKAMKDKEVK